MKSGSGCDQTQVIVFHIQITKMDLVLKSMLLNISIQTIDILGESNKLFNIRTTNTVC